MNQADLITPLHIELMIHYRCKTTRFPRADAPAVIEYTNVLKDLGLIRETTKDEEGDYRATDRGLAYLEALCRVPFPRRATQQ